MKKPMVCMVVLAAMLGAAVCAQQTESPAEKSSPAQTTPKAGFEILSDTMGVDFGPYLRQMHSDLQRNWEPLIPAKVNRPELKKGIVGIRIAILPSGRIGGMKLESPSGDIDLDKAAWCAITSEGQFPRLPKEFHGPQLELRLGFFYNEPVQPGKVTENSKSPN